MPKLQDILKGKETNLVGSERIGIRTRLRYSRAFENVRQSKQKKTMVNMLRTLMEKIDNL